MDYFAMTYRSAAELETAEKPQAGKPEELDFAVVPTCMMCDKMIHVGIGENAKVCSGCRSVVYCSSKCQAANWKSGKVPGTPTHKELCAANKVHMKKAPLVRAILKQFPWGRLEKDGSFAADVARARFGVLGAIGYGYWSTAGGFNPHLPNPDTIMPVDMNPFHRHVKVDQAYQHGYLLLRSDQLSEIEGWKLDANLIPSLSFNGEKPPALASQADIVDWNGWHQWRSLSMKSPAALLMHYPMSIYQLLVHVLSVAHPKRGSPNRRQRLNIHYLGAEVELNFLPLFAELALLLPYTDIRLVFFGVAVRDIVKVAKEHHPQSVAAKAAKSGRPIFEYIAPPDSGASTIRIHLHGASENWDPSAYESSGHPPDAVVAPNAGLLSYPSWQLVIWYCHLRDWPFAVTEYTEQSAEAQRMALPGIVHHWFEQTSDVDEQEKRNLTRRREYPIAFNPFQRPGQRGISLSRLPNVPNGFTMEVVGVM